MYLKLLTSIWTALILFTVVVHSSPMKAHHHHRHENKTITYVDFFKQKSWMLACGPQSKASLTSQDTLSTSFNARCQIAVSLKLACTPIWHRLINAKGRINIDDMSKWPVHGKNYTFLPTFDPNRGINESATTYMPSLLSSSALTTSASTSLSPKQKKTQVKNCRITHMQLRNLYHELEIYVGSFEYLDQKEIYQNDNRTTNHSEEIKFMQHTARVLLCEVRTVISRIRLFSPGPKITPVNEMANNLKFRNNNSAFGSDKLDLKYAKYRFITYVTELKSFINSKYGYAVRKNKGTRKNAEKMLRKSKQNQSTKDQQKNGTKLRNKRRHLNNKRRRTNSKNQKSSSKSNISSKQ